MMRKWINSHLQYLCVLRSKFGYNDETRETVKRYRSEWLEQGGKWFRPKYQPLDWNPEEQMKNIPALSNWKTMVIV